MVRNVVFLTGASSGIGRALREALPLENAQVTDISRSGTVDCEHFRADLADPTTWRSVADLFESRLKGFAGERAVFIHCAGTLHPMGAAGEVDSEAYERNVLLNSAAPQVLGHAFLRALGNCTATGVLVMISSGAAANVYDGWSSYGAGKAAVNQWVRTTGAEQARRGDRCRVIAIAPGVVETEMQERIRATTANDFPDVARFVEMHEAGELRQPDVVAREIWDMLLGDPENGAVVDLRDVAGH
jgi:benzil reductase ((S)-benzoin forming)